MSLEIDSLVTGIRIGRLMQQSADLIEMHEQFMSLAQHTMPQLKAMDPDACLDHYILIVAYVFSNGFTTRSIYEAGFPDIKQLMDTPKILEIFRDKIGLNTRIMN